MNFNKAIEGLRRSKELYPDDHPMISAKDVLFSVSDRWTAYFSLYSKCVIELYSDNYDQWIEFVNIARSKPE